MKELKKYAEFTEITRYGTGKRFFVPLDKICYISECRLADGGWFTRLHMDDGSDINAKALYEDVVNMLYEKEMAD